MPRVFSTSVATAILVFCASFAALLLFVSSVHAHGADWEVQIVGQRVAGYEATVRTEPKGPRVGRLHIEVQLIAPEDLTFVSEASVTATARFVGNEPTQAGPVRSRYWEPWYEMDLSLKKSGAWDVHLTIEGPRGQGETSFRINILPPQSGFVSRLLSPWTLSAAITVVLILVLYAWKVRRQLTSTPRPSSAAQGAVLAEVQGQVSESSSTVHRDPPAKTPTLGSPR